MLSDTQIQANNCPQPLNQGLDRMLISSARIFQTCIHPTPSVVHLDSDWQLSPHDQLRYFFMHALVGTIFSNNTFCKKPLNVLVWLGACSRFLCCMQNMNYEYELLKFHYCHKAAVSEHSWVSSNTAFWGSCEGFGRLFFLSCNQWKFDFWLTKSNIFKTSTFPKVADLHNVWYFLHTVIVK